MRERQDTYHCVVLAFLLRSYQRNKRNNCDKPIDKPDSFLLYYGYTTSPEV